MASIISSTVRSSISFSSLGSSVWSMMYSRSVSLVIADVLNVGHLPDRFIHSPPSSHIQNAVLFPGLVPQDSLIRIA